MKKRPSLILREPVRLHETNVEKEENQPKFETKGLIREKEQKQINEIQFESKDVSSKIENKEEIPVKNVEKDSIKEKLPPRIGQIWDYICLKAKSDGEVKRSFSLTRIEVMKEAGIGSTNTYRDALKRFQTLGLLEIELRPGVISGSLFTLTEKGLEQID